MDLAIAYACVLIAAVLPYVWVSVAKGKGRRYDNRDPRAWASRQDDAVVQRAHAAHLNAFEAFPPFAAGVAFAQLAGVPTATIAALSLAFVAFRVAHGLLYIAGRATLRSAAWLGGLGCVAALLVLAIRSA